MHCEQNFGGAKLGMRGKSIGKVGEFVSAKQ